MTDYTGDVTPRRRRRRYATLGDLTISKVSVGPMDNNAYLLRCASDGTQILIDAANDADRLLALIGPAGLTTVVTTHRHPDHTAALAEVVDGDRRRSRSRTPTTPAEIPVVDRHPARRRHGRGRRLLARGDPHRRATRRARSCCSTRTRPAPPTCGPATASSPAAWATPAATRRTSTSLIDDVEHKLFDRFPDDTWFYPGHGKDSTLGAERPAAEWRARGW